MKFIGFTIFLFSLIPTFAIENEYWPNKTWETIQIEQSQFDQQKLNSALKTIFAEDKKYLTHSFVLIEKGKLLTEQYRNPFDHQTKHFMWSAAKSFASTLIGIAVKNNKVQLSSPASKYYPQLTQEKFKPLTLKHILQMSSGLCWMEGYEEDILSSDVIRMLYGRGREDMAKYVASKSLCHPPGEKYYYSSGDTNLAMGILKKALGKNAAQFAHEELFRPIEMTGAQTQFDNSGTLIASSYLYLTPRDMARLGLFWSRNGRWKDQQILPTDWMKWATTMSKSYINTFDGKREKDPGHGAHFWLNQKPNENKTKNIPIYPQMDPKLFMALGHHGQKIIVIPDWDVVVVRTGLDKKGKLTNKMIFDLLLSARKSKVASHE